MMTLGMETRIRRMKARSARTATYWGRPEFVGKPKGHSGSAESTNIIQILTDTCKLRGKTANDVGVRRFSR